MAFDLISSLSMYACMPTRNPTDLLTASTSQLLKIEAFGPKKVILIAIGELAEVVKPRDELSPVLSAEGGRSGLHSWGNALDAASDPLKMIQ
ncbi:MAG: hypothetical protein RLN76_11310 [Phycisphaeraceae bacterium]